MQAAVWRMDWKIQEWKQRWVRELSSLPRHESGDKGGSWQEQ